MSRQAGLLNQDLLILQQFRSGFSPEFDILDDQGRVVGTVAGTEGGARSTRPTPPNSTKAHR